LYIIDPNSLETDLLKMDRTKEKALLGILIFLGIVFRLAPLGQHRFHPDEALYSFWALRIVNEGDFFLRTLRVDKPPFFIYLLALSFRTLGVSETVARLPNIIASSLGMLLFYLWLRELYGSSTALLGLAFMSFSPFNILFAPTVFTDPWLVVWILASLLLVAKRRWAWAGVAAGMAIATKQQGVLFLPLIAGLGALEQPGWRAARDFALGLLGPCLAIALWDWQRPPQPGFWQQSLRSYGGLYLEPVTRLGEKAAGWLQLLSYITASPWLNGLLLFGWPLLLLRELRSFALHNKHKVRPDNLSPLVIRHSQVTILISGFIIVYMLAHWLLSFQVWDRYLLGLVPLLSAILARMVVAGTAPLWALGKAIAERRGVNLSDGWRGVALVALLFPLLWPPAVQGAMSYLPVGGDHGAYEGIDDVAAYLRAVALPGTVLYHHWLGWHYYFYLYGAPVELRWYPSPGKLAEDAVSCDSHPCYIVFPSWHSAYFARKSLAEKGLRLEPVHRTYKADGTLAFTIYRIGGE